MTETVDSLVVVEIANLGPGDSAVFAYERDGLKRQGFVLRHGDEYFAYANCCPHWYVDLDLGDERFYDAAIDRIYCKNHAATFTPRDGHCDSGPCFGRNLERFETRVVLGRLEVLIGNARALTES